MKGLYTNRNAEKDFHLNAFEVHSRSGGTVHAAVAFLTDAEPFLKLADDGATVRVVIRLGYPTHPRALERLLKHERVLIHATTSTAFHPKLYIFQDFCAIVGSANMTQSGMTSNQEVSVEIPAEDPRFEALSDLFDVWWFGSTVLDSALLDIYRKAFSLHSPGSKENALTNAMKDVCPGNLSDVDFTKRKPLTRQEMDLDAYQRTYEEFLMAFQTLSSAYAVTGVRAMPGLPLRLEIDGFLGWLREAYARADGPENAPLRAGKDFQQNLQAVLREWQQHASQWDARVDLMGRLDAFQRTLGTPESIEAATSDELVDTLLQAHAIGDRLRYYDGGRPTQRAAMLEQLPRAALQRTLTYLLHGKAPFVERMARCIRDPAWKLNGLGRSAVQEVFGWVNADDIPICNERTLKSMRWLGLDVRVQPHSPTLSPVRSGR